MTGYAAQNPGAFQGDKYKSVMEPESLPQPSSSFSSKFVAGPTRLERNPLCPPAAVRGEMELTRQLQPTPLNPTHFDLTKADGQFERYKHMMQRSVYN